MHGQYIVVLVLVTLRAKYRLEFGLNHFKLYMYVVYDERRNTIDFGSCGRMSRPTLAPNL